MSSLENELSLQGQLLIAMPGMMDPRFSETVIFLCSHSSDGAMGIVVNRLVNNLDFPALLKQIGIQTPQNSQEIRIQFGGPVETSRGFVLHSCDYGNEATMQVDKEIGLTASVDILRAMACGKGPQSSLLALGYTGWGPGQLDYEFHNNAWLNVPADHNLIFGNDLGTKWHRAAAKIGIDISLLSPNAGHA